MALSNVKQTVEFLYDFSKDGGAISTIALSAKNGKSTLPLGAVVTSVFAKVITTCTSLGSATVEWGNTTDTDGYSGAGIAVASLTANSVFNGWDNAAALLWDDTNDHPIYPNVTAANDSVFSVTIGTAALTAGKIVFVVEFYVPAIDL
jgi:hypothetical protein